MATITQNVLYKRLVDGSEEPVMGFFGNQPRFVDKALGKYFSMFGVPEPESPQKKTISFPGKSSSPEELKVFKEAFVHLIGTDPVYKGYFWKTKIVVHQNKSS